MSSPTARQALWAALLDKLSELPRTLRAWPWFDTLRTLRQRFREDRLGLTASSLTFTTLIGLVPLATVTLALFSAFPIFARFQVALQEYFVQSLVPDNIAKPVLQSLTQFAAKANRVGVVGLVLLLLTALAMVFTIDRTLNGIWRVRKPRPWAQRLLVYWAALTLGPLLLGASLSLTSYALSASRGLVAQVPGAWGWLLDVFEFVLLAGGMTAMFRHVPNTHVRWEHAVAGGVFVALGFDLAKRALGWYLAKVPTYSVIYGAFATVPILLLWIYLGWVIVLLGAVIAAYAPSLAMRVVRQPDRPGQRFTLALSVLGELLRARQAEPRGLSLEALAAALRVDPLQIEPLLARMIEMDWVARLDESGAQRHVLLVEPADTPAAPLVDALLLHPAPANQGLRRAAELHRLTLAALLDS
jgi:membrane protein